MLLFIGPLIQMHGMYIMDQNLHPQWVADTTHHVSETELILL